MELSDETLVQQAVGLEDLRAFETLVRRHQSRILLLMRQLSRDHALAEDLCQETFLRAWRKLSTFSNKGSFGGWLAKLGYNVFLQHLRRGNKERNTISSTEIAETLPAPSSGFSDELPDLQRLLGVVSPEERVVLVLNYAHGLSNSEIAGILDVPVGTVKSQVHRAKEKIRSHFRIGGEAGPAGVKGAPTGASRTGQQPVAAARSALSSNAR
jgi:RNA polymerase sigma-70 factor (ECF subfamily)